MSFSVHLKPGGKTIPFKYDFTKSSNDIPNVKKLHTVMKKNTLDFLTIYLAIGKKTYRRRFRRKKMATTVTAITRRNPKAMTGYKIIAGITCFSVEDGLGISTERERERKKKKSSLSVT